jgi:hypothetical protein
MRQTILIMKVIGWFVAGSALNLIAAEAQV